MKFVNKINLSHIRLFNMLKKNCAVFLFLFACSTPIAYLFFFGQFLSGSVHKCYKKL